MYNLHISPNSSSIALLSLECLKDSRLAPLSHLGYHYHHSPLPTYFMFQDCWALLWDSLNTPCFLTPPSVFLERSFPPWDATAPCASLAHPTHFSNLSPRATSPLTAPQTEHSSPPLFFYISHTPAGQNYWNIYATCLTPRDQGFFRNGDLKFHFNLHLLVDSFMVLLAYPSQRYNLANFVSLFLNIHFQTQLLNQRFKQLQR